MSEVLVRAMGKIKQVPAFPGVIRRTLATGDNLTLVRIEVQAGEKVPEHTHPHEQAGTVIAGRMSIRVGDVTADCETGDSYMIPGGVPHEITGYGPVTLIEAFSPVRQDFIDEYPET